MYFVGLTRMHQFSRPLLAELDVFLRKYYSSMHYFTPKTIARELNISEDLAWELTFCIRDTGLITNILVAQCTACNHISLKQDITICDSCGKTEPFEKGYYFTFC